MSDPDVYERLVQLSPLRSCGIQYLASREISVETARHFQLAQIQSQRETLSKLISEFTLERVVACGLTNQSDALCFPQDSIVFPYRIRGRVQWLQARCLPGSAYKWLNLRRAKPIPFNLDQVSKSKTVYLCEGAMDVLSAYELGLTAVGLPGAQSIFPELGALLVGKTVYVVPDSDSAGELMIRRVRDRLAKARVQITVQRLDGAKDLNDHLQRIRGQAK